MTKKPEIDLKIEGVIAKLSVSPGDLLVIKIDGMITQEMATRVREKFQGCLPPSVRCVVIDGSMTLSVVTADDPLGLTRQ